MQKLKTLYGEKKQEFWELVRYVVAGGITTLVSLIISYGCYFLLAAEQAADNPALQELTSATWVIGVINSATAAHIAVGNVIAWIVAVIFAFWINRWMVFRVHYDNQKDRFTAFFQFVSARVISLVLFEIGFAALLNLMGVSNILGRMIVLVLVMVFNYVASKFWIFKPKQ